MSLQLNEHIKFIFYLTLLYACVDFSLQTANGLTENKRSFWNIHHGLVFIAQGGGTHTFALNVLAIINAFTLFGSP